MSDILFNPDAETMAKLYQVNIKYNLLMTLFRLRLVSNEEMQEVFNTLRSEGIHVDGPW